MLSVCAGVVMDVCTGVGIGDKRNHPPVSLPAG